MKNEIARSAILLAGGDSKRMGTNKALLRLGDNLLIDTVFKKLNRLFEEIIIVTDREEKLNHLPAIFTRDVFDEGEKNPLRGIHAGLTSSSSQCCFVIACDMPFFSLPLIRYMSSLAPEFDIVVPRVGGYFQPLFALYNKTALEAITASLQKKEYKIVDLYARLNVKEIDEDIVRSFDSCMLSFYNINTRDDYINAQKYIASGCTGIS